MTEPAPLPIATPPGWYPEPPTGRQRWWDGIQWAFYPPEVAYPTTYRRPTNGVATASLVLGIVGMVMCTFIIPSVLAVVFGIIGARTANQLGGVGKGKAIWGLVLGGIVLFVLTVALVVNLSS